MSILEKYESLSPGAQKQIEDYIDFLLSRDLQDESTSVEEYNKEIDEAEAEIERGEFFSHEEALKEIRSWREK